MHRLILEKDNYGQKMYLGHSILSLQVHPGGEMHRLILEKDNYELPLI